MKKLLIVAHTPSPNTQRLAEAIEQGAPHPDISGVEVNRIAPLQAGPDAIRTCDAIILFTTENLGYMSGALKDFFDRCYYPALDKLNGRPYASLICAGSDGQNAARQIERIATGWRLKAVAPPLIVCTQAQTPAEILAPKTIPPRELERCAELGAALAAGLALGIF